MRLKRGGWLVAAGMLVSCGGDDVPPLTGTIEAWSDEYVYILSPGDSALSSVTLYNGTSVSIVRPSCTTATSYPVAGSNVIAAGFSILRQTPDGSWVEFAAGIPACVDPAEDQVLQSGYHGAIQQVLVPTAPGRYSWVLSYRPSEASEEIRKVASPAVTVLAP